ncbi:2-hydroxyacid dehydrogenase [Streptomyces sp. NBC_01808]|uniref:2-hydroxyacid dehydrogenase n=1 Tax=Streptomyces sp. NBC_01808 TaxID=2975947 RepID=UPI002DDA2EDF|nr:2-hydroxyacid dehydrogenase [Streptomyces sp. NBC_01808]WSA36040.1 2-hydroxyacid dehydrogenase [Streptomyces sp. NBC_01808]
MTRPTTAAAGRVLQAGPLAPSLAATLRTSYGALQLPNEDPERAAFLAAHGGDIVAAVTSGRFGVGTDLMTALPRLGAVINFGVGYDTTDTALARRRGVLVSNTPDVLTDCVADTALGLTLDLLRGLSAADRFVRAGRWPHDGGFPLMRKVSGARVGILGLGRIGRAIATRFAALGCTVSYHSRKRAPGTAYAYADSPDALAAASDVLIVATSGGAGTRGLVSRAVLRALGPDGYLINVSRGSVVDEHALVEMLTTGALGGAGLDVYAAEPHVPETLFALDNVVLLPHVGSATVQTRTEMERLTLDNLAGFLNHGTLVTPVPETA